MNYIIYSTLSTYQQGQVDILKLVNTEQEGISLINDIIVKIIIDNNGKLHLKKAFVNSVDDISKEISVGLYVVSESNEITVYNKSIVKKRVGFIFSSHVDETLISKHITFYIKSIPKEGNFLESICESVRVKKDVPAVIDAIEEMTKSPHESSIVEIEPDTKILVNPNVIENEIPTNANVTKTEIPTSPVVEDAALYDLSQHKDYSCHVVVNDKLCHNISEECNGRCDTHSIHPIFPTCHRSKIVRTITPFFGQIAVSIRDKKIDIISPLFDLIVMNIRTIDSRGFNEAVIKKLQGLKTEMRVDELCIFNPQTYLDFFSGNDNLEFVKRIDKKRLEKAISEL
jgi:hypothetical protein